MNVINTSRHGWMKRYIMAGIILMVAGRTAVAKTYDLDAILNAVRTHNKDLQIAGENRNTGAVQQKEALATALPSVGFEAGYTRNLTDYYMYFDQSALMPGATGVIKAPVKRDNELSSTIALQQTLYSHEVGSAITASRQYTQLLDYTFEATEQAVLTGAGKLFYQCLFLEKVTDVVQAAETNALENYNDVKLKYDQGQVSEFDLLQAETRWRGTIPEVQQAERNLMLALNSLKNLAGIDINQEITLEGSLDVVPDMPQSIAMEQVLEERPDVQALEWEKALLQTNLEATKGAHKPRITGTLAYSYSSQSNEFDLDEENNLLFAGINLSIPIYTGGYLNAQVQKAAIEVKKSDLKIEKNKETISKDTVNARLRLEEAQLRIESARSTMDTAERAFHIAEITTREGLATQLQLKDTRLVFDQASINYYAAVFDYIAAFYDWEYTTGQMNQ